MIILVGILMLSQISVVCWWFFYGLGYASSFISIIGQELTVSDESRIIHVIVYQKWLGGALCFDISVNMKISLKYRI